MCSEFNSVQVQLRLAIHKFHGVCVTCRINQYFWSCWCAFHSCRNHLDPKRMGISNMRRPSSRSSNEDEFSYQTYRLNLQATCTCGDWLYHQFRIAKSICTGFVTLEHSLRSIAVFSFNVCIQWDSFFKRKESEEGRETFFSVER
ncbi:hypothetical protein U1Q18_013662 [Sarracenia purpurea var. burkii]